MTAKKMNMLGLLFFGAFFIAVTFGFYFLGSAVYENKVTTAKEEVAPQRIKSIANGINIEFVKNNLPPDSVVEGFATDELSKGSIWVEGETTPYTFYVYPVQNLDANKDSQLYVNVEGTLKDYTVTYADESYGFTAVYNSRTNKIDVTDAFQPLPGDE